MRMSSSDVPFAPPLPDKTSIKDFAVASGKIAVCSSRLAFGSLASTAEPSRVADSFSGAAGVPNPSTRPPSSWRLTRMRVPMSSRPRGTREPMKSDEPSKLMAARCDFAIRLPDLSSSTRSLRRKWGTLVLLSISKTAPATSTVIPESDLLISLSIRSVMKSRETGPCDRRQKKAAPTMTRIAVIESNTSTVILASRWRNS